ncbi:hypothetical protein [Amaricoccus sp.]|uniref:hypothetical protein n=1 Tax=Amaricoccus sp. TaxID=1872485 RepID=UPI001B6E0F63|nr:hypothetical protein [Amaricoccus sp.]MBP7003783.1 hypothetical protein [Amaricoccus sp.]
MKGFRKFLAGVVDALLAVDAARAASGAVESGRPPLARDLRRLGIDPQAFTSIGHG